MSYTGKLKIRKLIYPLPFLAYMYFPDCDEYLALFVLYLLVYFKYYCSILENNHVKMVTLRLLITVIVKINQCIFGKIKLCYEIQMLKLTYFNFD